MFRAMALKELRETRGIVLLALVAYAVVLWFQVTQLLRWRPQTTPFVDGDFILSYIWVSGGLAIALGMRQTLGESMVGAYPFLFHRPATRRWLIGMKMLAGMVAYLLCGLLPVLVYGMLTATPGAYASPFSWAMTEPFLVAWLAMTVLYFGAFLSGIRPARWFYSRLFPLAGAGLLALAPTLLYAELHHGTLASLASILLIDAWLAALILFVARSRDYA